MISIGTKNENLVCCAINPHKSPLLSDSLFVPQQHSQAPLRIPYSMASSSQNSHEQATSSVRVFRSSDIMGGTQMVLGRNHSSWFLCFATPYSQTSCRAWECLNLVQIHNPSTFPSLSHNYNFQFVTRNERVLESLLDLRDRKGQSPVKLTEKRVGRSFVVEVLLEPEEFIHACTHCGKWEALNAPRFRKCSGCFQRRYCSEKCQRKDWRIELHKGDCKLLRDGKEQEVERRRQTHDNYWNRSGQTSTNPDYGFNAALRRRDWEFVTYGVRTPLCHANERCETRVAKPADLPTLPRFNWESH